jgi:hypothetical protein
MRPFFNTLLTQANHHAVRDLTASYGLPGCEERLRIASFAGSPLDSILLSERMP